MNFAVNVKRRALGGLRAYFMGVKYEDLTSLDEITPVIRVHLALVYPVVIIVLSNWRLGTLLFDSPGLLTTIPGLVGFGISAYVLCLTPPEQETRRFLLLNEAAFFLGTCTGPFAAHQCFIMTATETALVLLPLLSWGALSTNGRRTALYIGVMIILVLILSWSGDSALIGPDDCYENPWAFKRWFASFCTMLYVLAYTQEMVATASSRRENVYILQRAVHFFTDLPAVIYHFGFILLMRLGRAFQTLGEHIKVRSD